MSRAENLNTHPLSTELTRRVVSYLNYFRLFISPILFLAYLSGGLIQVSFPKIPAFAVAALLGYMAVAASWFIAARHKRANHYRLALLSLFGDILFVTLFLFLFGGLASGLGVLMVFFSASAAILLSLRLALFLASLATIALIGESVVTGLFQGVHAEELLSTGILGLTNFLTVIFAHLLAFWVRDYRLIAERQRRTLTRLEQINELIIKRMSIGVLAVDHQGEIQMMNESAWYLLGNPASTDRVLAEVSPELHETMEAWRNRRDGDAEPITLKGSQAVVIPKFVALPGEHEIRTLVFLEDNDVAAQRAVELSTIALAKLSGSIAHEIRNPLAAATHAAQLLRESEDLPDADIRLIDIIVNQSRRMNGIVENILQLSRREKSRPELFEVSVWLREFYEEFSTALSRKDVELTCEIPDTESLVLFDRSQLHQALWKLLDNAMEHAGTEERTPQVCLRMERHAEGGYCVISVEDNGPGIPEERLEHIFEPFYTTRKQGSGLGLYVARQLCEANQSELTVDSTPGWKTRFHIRLSLARGESDMGVEPDDLITGET